MNRRQLLVHLVNANGWTCGAELGLWRGRMFCEVLAGCPMLTLYGVDSWAHSDGEMEEYRGWDHAANERRCRADAARFGARAVILKMTTLAAAARVAKGSLDFIFIDADHRADAVRADIQAWKPKLKPSGRLMGHDIDWPSVAAALEAESIVHWNGPDNVWMAI